MTELSVVNDLVAVIDGVPQTNSKAVAEYFGKRHSDVLRAVDNINCSAEFLQRNFALVMESITYVNANGKSTNKDTKRISHYNMTKDGFIFLIMGFTGKKAAALKEAYINEFNRMADTLNSIIGGYSIQHNKLCATLKTVDRVLSGAGRDLRQLGQFDKPILVKQIKELEGKMQLKLNFTN